MYTKSYLPKFPYIGEQVTIGSGRLVFHAKDDSAFIFASKAISLATSGSMHINAPDGTFINSPRIELGLNAQESVIKGDTFKGEMMLFYTQLENFVNSVGGISETEIEMAVIEINKTATTLSKTISDLKQRLPDILSTTTKTL